MDGKLGGKRWQQIESGGIKQKWESSVAGWPTCSSGCYGLMTHLILIDSIYYSPEVLSLPKKKK